LKKKQIEIYIPLYPPCSLAIAVAKAMAIEKSYGARGRSPTKPAPQGGLRHQGTSALPVLFNQNTAL